MRVAVGELPAHADQCAGQEHQHDHRKQRAELRQHRHPVGRGKGVADPGHAVRAFAPHQFAGVEDHHDHQRQAETAVDGGEHLVGDRPYRRAVDQAGRRQRDEHHRQRQQQQHQERRAAQHAQRVEHELRAQLRQSRAAVVADGNLRQRQRAAAGLRAQHRRLRALLAPRQLQAFAVGAEQRERGHQQQYRHRQPQQPVEQQHAVQRGQQVVGLLGRPVAGDQANGAPAEGIEHRREPAVVEVAAERADDALQHEVGDHADVAGQQRARDGGQQEQQRGDEQQIGQHQHPETPGVAAPVGSAQARGVHPRHRSAQRNGQRAGSEDRHQHQVTCQEAPAKERLAAHRRGEQQLRRVLLEIARGGGGDEHHHQQDAEHRHHVEQARDHQWRVARHVAGGAGHHDGIGAGQCEGDAHGGGEDDPEQRRPELLAPFEAEDFEQHGFLPDGRRQAVRAVACARRRPK